MTPKTQSPRKAGNGRRLAGWAHEYLTPVAVGALAALWTWLIAGGGR